MYISPELFHFRNDQIPDSNASPFYPMDEDSQKCQSTGSVLGKRSRTDEHHHSMYVWIISLTRSPGLTADRSRKTRTALSIKVSERDAHEPFHQTLPSPPFDQETFTVNQDAEPVNTFQSPHRHITYSFSKTRRRIAPSKKTRTSFKAVTSPPILDIAKTTIRLTPCHVCYKAPRLKKDLEAYADCVRCEERTCYICIRQCESGSCERKVCRQCCVEQGENGDVCCLDCLENTQDHEMED
jgi:hypothetical protein